MIGWMVNDKRTCIPGTRTLWHDLLDAIPGLYDMTGVAFDVLPKAVEMTAAAYCPDYVIRNASYFRRLDLDCPTICFVQDVLTGALADMQREVIEASDVAVYNSEFTREKCGGEGPVIPIGTDFNLFSPGEFRAENGPILFVGSTDPVKGWGEFQRVVEATNYEFVAVLKHGEWRHPRVRCTGPLSQTVLRDVMRGCSVLLCTSLVETQHLAGIEAGAVGLPLVVPPIGIYAELDAGSFGRVVTDGEFAAVLREVDRTISPRAYFQDCGLDRKTCMNRWRQLIP